MNVSNVVNGLVLLLHFKYRKELITSHEREKAPTRAPQVLSYPRGHVLGAGTARSSVE